ncbi:MAG TPA: hypothetical protein VKZ57_16620 [Sphingobacterium sp.]|jgi:hypothetical protein|nr:hypothetical protein [Sphingobacterium sp.]
MKNSAIKNKKAQLLLSFFINLNEKLVALKTAFSSKKDTSKIDRGNFSNSKFVFGE